MHLLRHVFKLLLELIHFQYDMVTLFVQSNVPNKNERKTRSESRDTVFVKTILFNDSVKRSVFSAARGRMILNSVYDVIGNMVGSNKR